MVRRRVLLVLAFAFSLLFGAGAVAQAAPGPLGRLDLGSLGGPATQGCSVASYDGNSRYGPQTFSTQPPTGRQLAGYQRFGSYTGVDAARNFDEKYYDADAKWWIYPPEQGYVLDRNKQPIKHKKTLPVGTRMDRYGGEGGNFLAVPGTKYAARALPPSNLSGPQGQEQYCNYHVYEVIKTFSVDTGRIAPWFAQRGGGIQYQVVRSYLDDPSYPQCISFINQDGTLSVGWLKCAGYLRQSFPAVS
ncbi:TNT domain-containing protein [Streptomyces sp. SID6673]|nr:TNT domain-containing protein [Streptomyces sp. SID11726]NEB25493.1 TNT domain-containing protein [Streptomyces sp. SID6673]